MSALYIRVKENGAQVFRVVEDPRDARTRLEPLAVVNHRSGEVRAQGGRAVSETERAEIDAWLAARQEVLAAREVDDVRRAVEAMQATAAWAQRAEAEAVVAMADEILMAALDLRQTIVRRLSED